MRTITTLALLSLIGSCAKEIRHPPDATQQRGKARNITLRISCATVNPEPGFVAMIDRDLGPVHVDPFAILTERDIVSAKVTKGRGQNSIILELTSEAAAIFADYTSKHIMGLLAVLVDDELISTPKIHSTIRGEAEITSARTLEWAEDVARRLEGR